MRLFKHTVLTCALLSGLTFTSCSTTPVSGKKSFLLTSSAEENAQGDEAYQEILKKEKVITGTAQSKMVEEIGNRIAAVANQPDFKWEFKTIESKEPNAFCLPGGKVAVYTGIFQYAKNEAGLATVMGHEIGHAIARHAGQRMSQAMATNVLMAGVAVVGLGDMESGQKNMIMGLLGAGATVGVILPFSRSNETEADSIGLNLMSKAGYDPRESVNFWDRFAQADKGGGPPAFLSTHPASKDRKTNLEKQLPKVLPLYEASSKVGIGRSL
jgi:predicted Zn-dependent protease